VTCVARDVTERKQSEAVLLEREEKFREIFNKANDAIHLHEVGEDGSPGKFIDVNDVACQMVQYSRDEMLQHGPLDFATQYHSRPADTIFKELGTIGHATFETGHKRKDGIIVPVEVNAHKITLQGRTVVLSVVRDITKRKESEETQLILTEFQKGVITNARVWMSVLDQRGNILMWNTAAEEISGYRAEEVTGKNGIWKLLYPQKEYRKQITDTINRIIHDQKYLENFETTIRSKQGNEKIISWNTKGIPDATGKISDYIAIGVDVTDRHLAEKMLRESEERYRTVIENASEAIVVVQDGLLKYVNPKTVEILQTTHEKVIGKSFPDFVHPDDRALIFERYQRRVEGKNVPTNYDFRIVGENGRLIWVILSAVQILWEGRPATLNFLIEITERKQIEAALQKSEEKFRTVLENVPDLILVHRIGTILYINPSATEVMGYTRDELINKQMTDFIVPEYHPFVAQSISRRMNGNPVEPYEIEILTKSGKRRTVVVGGSLIEFAGAPASLNVLTDITERKQAEDALRQANKQLNLLSSITRHDILNQLMALKGYIELSRDYLDDKKTLGDFLEKEEKSARTIEDQITFTKNYQELGAAAPEWQSVNASIKKAVAGLPMRAVHVKPDPADPEVYADPLFEKVFYNLIDNALRYGGDQMKTIRVSSQESDASLTIICEDDGVGITAEDKKRLFTRGFGKNTGLGLFLSREILAITGITITENGTPGKGARFEITVPKGMWRMNGAKK
jgi:PAS domain S-box-containing protein